MVLTEIFYSALANKCPRCHKGKVFEVDNPYNLGKAFKMRDRCTECSLKYEREIGFFYGAMYVSYGLMAGILIIWLVLNAVWLDMGPAKLVGFVIATMVLFFPVAFRWARLLWLNFFVRYDKDYAKKYPKLNVQNDIHHSEAQKEKNRKETEEINS